MAGEPKPEWAVIELPRCGRILPRNCPGATKLVLQTPTILEDDLNRRSFVMSLFGGLAAASLGGTAIAQAATVKPSLAPALPEGALDTATKTALDQADADFNQVVVRRTTVVRRPAYGRPVAVRRTTVVRRPVYGRPVAVRRTTVVRRPAYGRPVVVRRGVVVR
jgi:hypothetical protein